MNFKDILTRWNNGLAFGAQSKFAASVGVDQGTVSRWMNGLPPNEELRPRIAKILGITVEELMDSISGRKQESLLSRAGIVVPTTFKPFTSRLKVVGTVSAEKFDFSFDYETGEFEEVDLPRDPGKKAALLRVSGKCMEPKINSGDLVVVVEAGFDEIPNGGLAVIRLNGECTLKRVHRMTDGIELRPDNKAHKTIKLSGDEPANVVGVVRWIIRKP